MSRNHAGNLIPTSSQVYLALEVLRSFSKDPQHSHMVRESSLLIHMALQHDNWDGASPSTSPFGHSSHLPFEIRISHLSQGEIQSVLSLEEIKPIPCQKPASPPPVVP